MRLLIFLLLIFLDFASIPRVSAQLIPCTGKYSKKAISHFFVRDSLVFGSYKSSLVISFDKGKTWDERTNNFLESGEFISAIWANDSIVLVGTGNDDNKEAHIYRSLDVGKSWHHLGTFRAGETTVNAIGNKGDTLYACTGYGIFRSPDFGSNWERCNNGLPAFKKTYCMAANDSLLFIGGKYGVYCSRTNGDFWMPCNKGIERQSVTKMSIHNNQVFLLSKGVMKQELPCTSKWLPFSKGIQTNFVNQIRSHGENDLYISAFWQLYQSDNCQEWKVYTVGVDKRANTTTNEIKGKPINDFIIIDDQLLISYSGNGIFIQTISSKL